MDASPQLEAGVGPAGWRNWRACLRKAPEQSWQEYGLYSDAIFYGAIERNPADSPYQVLNAFNAPWTGSRAGPDQPVLFLRVGWHLGEQPTPQMDATDTGSYHGGDVQDEIAALISLAIGARLKAGHYTRMADSEDPRGRPWADTERPIPMVGGPASPRILPGFQRPRTVTDALLETYYMLSPADATALVRAARLYQDAVWIAEAEPQLSWLMLVSAIETAAGQWRSQRSSARDLFLELEPDLASKLSVVGGDEAVGLVARHLSHQLRATRKFIDFSMNFLPPAPEHRPPTWLQLDWSPSHMRATLAKIYIHRSGALHAGTPFPWPMCFLPFRSSEQEPPAEVPHGSATAAQGGVWTKEDTPLLLHTFEYITRGVITNWWKAVIPEKLELPLGGSS